MSTQGSPKPRKNNERRCSTSEIVAIVIGVLLVGFGGGALSRWLMDWMNPVNLTHPSDAISIANTFIVFTSFIFVGATAILAIAVYVFMHQLTASSMIQEAKITDRIVEKLEKEPDFGVKLVESMMGNPDVSEYVRQKFSETVSDVLNESIGNREHELTKLGDMREKLKANGGSK